MSKLKIRDQSDPNTWYEVPAGGVGVPSGGTAGQILMKSSSTDYADEWHTLTPDDIGAMSTWELLWQNASQGSSFSAQTVSLDLTNYDAVIVVYRNEPGSDNGWNTSFIVFRDRPLLGLAMSGNAKFSYRVTTMYDSGVRFENGMFASSYGGAATDNSKSIPAKIYGIKGVETT